MTGIYFLLDGDLVVYIGQTIRYPKRIKEHTKKVFTSHRFIACDESKLSVYEKRLIKFFRPKYNYDFTVKRKPYTKITMSMQLKKELLDRIAKRAIKEDRSKSYIVEKILEKYI